MAEPGTNQPGGGVTIRYHKSTFLQVWAYNVTNNTNMHHGNQSGRARGYNFSLRKTEEAKYPFILCQRVAFILKQEAAARGFHFPEDLQQQVQVDDNVGKRQLFASQPRSRKLKPLVSEFMGYNTLVCSVSLPNFLDKMPKGARVCHRQVEWGFCRADANEIFSSCECASGWEDNTICEIIHVGIPRAPEDFPREAVSKGHPRNLIARVPEAVQEAIEASCWLANRVNRVLWLRRIGLNTDPVHNGSKEMSPCVGR